MIRRIGDLENLGLGFHANLLDGAIQSSTSQYGHHRPPTRHGQRSQGQRQYIVDHQRGKHRNRHPQYRVAARARNSDHHKALAQLTTRTN